MENKEGHIMLSLLGTNGKMWEIDYFSIIKYEAIGNDTIILTLHNHLNLGESRLSVRLTLPGFLNVYNQAKEHVERLQDNAFNTLNDIQHRHSIYFEMTKTDIKKYLIFFWKEPIEIQFSAERELPSDIKAEIQKHFWTVQEEVYISHQSNTL